MTRLRRLRDERGANSLELAMYAPLMMFIVFLAVQFAMSWHASQVASAAAREAARVARIEGGTDPALDQGEDRGRDYAEALGGKVLLGVDVDVVRIGDQVRATVSGTAVEVIPGFTPSVSETVQGPMESFRPDVP